MKKGPRTRKKRRLHLKKAAMDLDSNQGIQKRGEKNVGVVLPWKEPARSTEEYNERTFENWIKRGPLHKKK